MLSFILRRLLATGAVLLVASFIVYVLTAYSGDPLQELRVSNDPNAQIKIADLTARLQLDVPPVARYFLWLTGAAGCLIGQCNLGPAISRGEQPVIEALGTAIGSTLQLVIAATLLSILIGVAIGMTTALRQYSGYDYSVTLFAFVFYSLPIFWVAVLLKEYGAIRFNQFLSDPVIDPFWMVAISLVLSFVISGIVGGTLITRVRVFGFAVIFSFGLMIFLNLTQWLAQPSLGLVGVTLSTALVALVVIVLTMGLASRQALMVGAIMVAAVAALWLPFRNLYYYFNNPLSILITLLALAGIGFAAGWLLGGDNRRELSRVGLIIGSVSTLPLIIDQVLLQWSRYTDLIPLKSGIISTIGATTPSLAREDNMWLHILDSYAHLVLPTAALMIVSVAGYTRYSRATLLEVLNQDYIRTARAKGLPERTVILRHAFRNAMIPIATIISFDFGAVIGGAIITERVFAWQGMGALFNQGLNAVDVNLVMGFFLITGLLAVVFNIVADLLYSALDPRIRVN